MTKLYLVRHAEATGNVEYRFQGLTDTNLTPTGHRQIEFLAERFRDVHLDAVYSSPLLRTRQTAEGLTKYNGLPIGIEPGLIEIDGGLFENVLMDELLTNEKYSHLFYQYRKDPANFPGAGDGESLYQVYDRMVEAVNRLVAKHPGETIACVSHGCSLHCYMTYAMGLTIPDYERACTFENTAVACVVYQDDGSITIEFESDASHVPPEMKLLTFYELIEKEEAAK